MRLAKAASVGHGITRLSSKQIKEFTDVYESSKNIEVLEICSCFRAATRMFKALFEFDESFKQANFDSKTLTKEAYKHVKEFFDRIDEFAFYEDLVHVLKKTANQFMSSSKRMNIM